jgi:hypothetical protein
MNSVYFITDYMHWHYRAGFSALANHAHNLVLFIWQVFAPVQLVSHLFSPWRRLHESYPKSFNLQAYTAALIVNTMMRGVSAVARTGLFVLAVFCLLVSCVVAVIALIGWALLPAVPLTVVGMTTVLLTQ